MEIKTGMGGLLNGTAEERRPYNTQSDDLKNKALKIFKRATLIEKKQSFDFWIRRKGLDSKLSAIKWRAKSCSSILRPSRNPDFNRDRFNEARDWVLGFRDT